MVAFSDKTLVCRDCSTEFVFSAGEQEFYLGKGLVHEPQRCASCRARRRTERANVPAGTREVTDVTCASCGAATTVPFVPRLDRPVYCSSCFERVRSGSAG